MPISQKTRRQIARPLVLLLLLIIPVMAATTPNILFIIADDSSCHWGQAYNCSWVKTPHIDALAKQGIIFDNCYTPTSKCAPSRASILTGRNPWQLEDAANHMCYFPSKFMSFGDRLAASGILAGSLGKVWGPGEAKDAAGVTRDWGMPAAKGGKESDPGAGLTTFLSSRQKDQPFFFWFGSHYPHRSYKKDSGIAAGKKITDIDRVPSYWPDNEIVRSDMLDYAVEVEGFDAQVGSLMKALEKSGELANTIIIVTSDHGMPFPRVKGHTYTDAHRVPMVISWANGLQQPGRRVKDYISFVDLAPTFLALQQVSAGNMAPITGRGFVDLLLNKPEMVRDYALIGRERNDWGRPELQSYPARGMVTDGHLLVLNYKSDRWPCGNPEAGYPDTDDSPTKQLLADGRDNPALKEFWQHCFGMRPEEQFFNLTTDPDNVKNLATDPSSMAKKEAIKAKLTSILTQQQDPRASGNGDVFDAYVPTKTDWIGKFEKLKAK